MITRWLPLSLFCIIALIFSLGLTLNPQKLSTPKIGKMLPEFDLPLLVGEPDRRFTPNTFHHKTSILVVWASWCEACREEQAFLMTLAQHQDVNLYGLNYKDNPTKAKQWLMNWGNPYQAIGVDKTGKLAMDLGAYGTPETYLIAADGTILHRYAGVLTEAIWSKEFQALSELR